MVPPRLASHAIGPIFCFGRPAIDWFLRWLAHLWERVSGTLILSRLYGNEGQKGLLSPWPVPEPGNYLEWLNRSQPKEEVEKIRYAIKRSKPARGAYVATLFLAMYALCRGSLWKSHQSVV